MKYLWWVFAILVVVCVYLGWHATWYGRFCAFVVLVLPVIFMVWTFTFMKPPPAGAPRPGFIEYLGASLGENNNFIRLHFLLIVVAFVLCIFVIFGEPPIGDQTKEMGQSIKSGYEQVSKSVPLKKGVFHLLTGGKELPASALEETTTTTKLKSDDTKTTTTVVACWMGPGKKFADWIETTKYPVWRHLMILFILILTFSLTIIVCMRDEVMDMWSEAIERFKNRTVSSGVSAPAPTISGGGPSGLPWKKWVSLELIGEFLGELLMKIGARIFMKS